MHILNTTFSLVLSQVGFALPLSTMMFVNFFEFVPNDLIEAAIIDGCTPYGIFFKIMIPLAKNTFVTVASIGVSILPPIIVYFLLNRHVTAGMTVGATKG